MSEDDDYIITQISQFEFDVWKEGNGEPYRVEMYPRAEQCNCPQWKFRLRSPGRKCKHIKLIEEKGAWNISPIKVVCSKCDEYKWESNVEFVDIAEDIQGYDELTFICPQCHTTQKSRRFKV